MEMSDSQLASTYTQPIRECIDSVEEYYKARPWLKYDLDFIGEARARLTQLVANGVALHNQEKPEQVATLTDRVRELERTVQRLQNDRMVLTHSVQEAAKVAKEAMAQRDVAVLELTKARKGWAKAAERLGKVRRQLHTQRSSELGLKLVLNDLSERLAWLSLQVKETLREEATSSPAGGGDHAGGNGK